MVFLSGSAQEYKLFPSALITRAMDCVAVRADGGVEVSSAAAKTFRFDRPMMLYHRKVETNLVSVEVLDRSGEVTTDCASLVVFEGGSANMFLSFGKFYSRLRDIGELLRRKTEGSPSQ